MIVGYQLAQRPCDEKLKLIALLPTKHGALVIATDLRSEPLMADFFNDPRQH